MVIKAPAPCFDGTILREKPMTNFSLRQKRLTGDGIAAQLGRGWSSAFYACVNLAPHNLPFRGQRRRGSDPEGKNGANAAGHQAFGLDMRDGVIY